MTICLFIYLFMLLFIYLFFGTHAILELVAVEINHFSNLY